MVQASRFTDPTALTTRVANLVGPPRSMTRLPGGSKKGVYRVELTDRSTVVAYTWDESENYWDVDDDEVAPFTHASGQALFLRATETLRQRGIRTLNILAEVDGLVLVEDLRGGNLEQLMHDNPHQAHEVLTSLRSMLESLHAERTPELGRLGRAVSGAASCEQIAHQRAVRHLAQVRARGLALSEHNETILDEAFNEVVPRREHALIHGEIGPDHIYLDDAGAPVLIDIEGLMHFDLEWEHAFLRLRFGAAYEHLRPPGLDEHRMRLYTLCLRLSLIAGPLRLLDGDFPHRDAMLAIVESNLAALNAHH